MMKRVIASIPEDILKQIDISAEKENKSRSAYLSDLIQRALFGHENDSNMIQAMNQTKIENENLKLRIKDLETSLRWLQGEYSKLSDTMIQKALPKKSVFSKLKFWKKE